MLYFRLFSTVLLREHHPQATYLQFFSGFLTTGGATAHSTLFIQELKNLAWYLISWLDLRCLDHVTTSLPMMHKMTSNTVNTNRRFGKNVSSCQHFCTYFIIVHSLSLMCLYRLSNFLLAFTWNNKPTTQNMKWLNYAWKREM